MQGHNKEMDEYETIHGKLSENQRRLPELDLYGCRHSFATNALAEGYDPALISSIMGNSVKTLLTFYAHPDSKQQISLITNFAEKAL